ncbi:MAG: hypothetical protein ABJQ23_14915 [Shimia thalassica]|uniref:hypothetical protein n=1 Tax=Shimia thalassica TaxID=1715693 RepID=UPI0032967EDF
MITFSLNTFIKICLLDTGGRISEIQKKLSGSGGYDFYKPLQNAVRSHCAGQQAEVEDILEAPTNEIERKHNQSAYDGFATRFGKTKSLEAIKSAKLLEFPNAGIAISVAPLFELTKAGSRQIYCIWPTQKPPLSQKYGAVACHVMRRAFSTSAMANGSFHFADVVSNRVYSEKQISNNTNLILMADINSVGTLIKEL